MQLNLRLALISALALLPMISHATDGEINITGTIVANTCNISSGNEGKHAVQLLTVPAKSLLAPGATAGRTPVTITLADCMPASGKVSLFFEPGSGTDMITGKLKNMAPLSTDAKNVQVGLLNADFSPIALDKPQAFQNSQLVDITSGGATLTYFAEYYSLGGVTAGAVKADTFFTLTYP